MYHSTSVKYGQQYLMTPQNFQEWEPVFILCTCIYTYMIACNLALFSQSVYLIKSYNYHTLLT